MINKTMFIWSVNIPRDPKVDFSASTATTLNLKPQEYKCIAFAILQDSPKMTIALIWKKIEAPGT